MNKRAPDFENDEAHAESGRQPADSARFLRADDVKGEITTSSAVG